MTSVHGSRCKKPRLTACPEVENLTVQRAEPGNAADLATLPAALLQKVFRHLSFNRQVACEFVCRSWRNVLRCLPCHHPSEAISSESVWGSVKVDLIRGAPAPIALRVNGRSVTVQLNEVSSPFSGPQAAFLAWLRQRAAGAKSIELSLNIEEPGWMFPQLVMTLHSFSTSSTPCPPVTLHSGESHVVCFSMSALKVMMLQHTCRHAAFAVAAPHVNGLDLMCVMQGQMQSWALSDVASCLHRV